MTMNKTAMQYINAGLSVIPANEDKTPATRSWKEYQKRKMTGDEVNRNFKDAKAIAIICGKVSESLEVIDIDCKYDKSGTLAKNLFEMFKDSLPDVMNKLVIAKTVNNGWHVLYRCETIEGNKKLAKNPDNEVLIETRGEGGYIIAPPSPGYELKKGDIGKIPVITPTERETLFNIARLFDETADQNPPAEIDNKTFGLSVFDDYNQRGDVTGLLQQHGWKIIREQGQRIHLKRPGNTNSKVSGNWHTTKRIFYPFTSSTVFEQNKGYNATGVFALLECNNDFSEASHRLYDMGYGERETIQTAKQKPVEKSEPIQMLPIEGFPKGIREYIEECTNVYGTHRDFWAGALISATALAIGDKLELKTKYSNVPVLWMCLVGDVSSGKTEPIKQLLQPFRDIDSESFQNFEIQKNEFDRFMKLTPKERKNEGLTEMEKPQYFQYILNDFTPEAMAEAHRINNRGIIIERDEFKGWLDDIGRYNKSGEQSNMLSTFNRIGITYNRKGSGVIRIPKPTIFVLGGMQPDLLPSLAKDNRAENGFLSRMCMVYPDGTEKPPYNENVIPEVFLKAWEQFVKDLLGISETTLLQLDPEAKTIYENWYNHNRDLINKEKSGYLMGVFGKLDIISLRLAVVIKGMYLISENDYSETINGKIMQAAIDITEYFRATALKVYQKIQTGAIQQMNPKDIAQFLLHKGAKKTDIAKVMGTHRQQVQRYTKNEKSIFL